MFSSTSILPLELKHLAEHLDAVSRDTIWAELPLACWCASGGDTSLGSIGTLAFLTGTIALKRLDDVQDGHKHPRQSNDGVALAFHALQILTLLPSSDPSSIMRLQQSYINTILTLCAGQHLDLLGFMEATPLDLLLERSWKIARKKTSEWFAWGASLYPRFIGDETVAQRFERFGVHLGFMHQIANDLRGFFDISDKGDLIGRKASLPVAYLQTVMRHSLFEKGFAKLWTEIDTNPSARYQVVHLAYEMGLDTYFRTMSNYHAEQAYQAVASIYPSLTCLIGHPNLTITRIAS